MSKILLWPEVVIVIKSYDYYNYYCPEIASIICQRIIN